jgi:glycosyltransferase involved in cell wall biosynthesis
LKKTTEVKANDALLLFVVNIDWFFLSHRLPIALEAIRQGWQVHIATGLTDRRRELEEHGLIVHPLQLERAGVGILNALGSAWELLKVIRQVRPHVIHTVTIKPVLLGGMVARIAKVPSLVSAVPGLGSVFVAKGLVARLKRMLVRSGYRIALRHRNQKVIFQNTGDQQTVLSMAGVDPSDVVLIRGSGADLARFIPRPWPEGAPIVVLASRLLWNKGIQEFVSAARLIRQRGGDAKFVLVGTPDAASPTSVPERQIDEWVREGVIEWWGQRSDMEAVLAASNLVVLPSYSEGIPKILIEAAACARPVVTTDVPGCREAIEVGVTGVVVPCRDSTALANAIEQMLSNPAKCKLMGEAGRALAEREYDVAQVARAHLRIYSDLKARA